jgi:hypothetical protein
MSQSDKEYKIGQVVYVVLNKEGKVYPMQIIQIITKTSLKGTETNYVLRGNPSANQTVMLSDISGEVFDTDVECRTALINRASRQLNKLVDAATKKANEWFPDAIVSQEPSVDTLFEPAPRADTVVVDMGDGTVANVKLPAGLAGA